MKEITVCVAGLPFAWALQVGYEADKNDEENVLSALIKATMLAGRDIGKRITSTESCIHIADTTDTEKPIYEAIFELKNGKKYLGYSSEADLKINGSFAHCYATKELKGLVAVSLSDILHFRFAPV